MPYLIALSLITAAALLVLFRVALLLAYYLFAAAVIALMFAGLSQRR